MNKKNVVSQSSFLQEMVQIKKLRFKDVGKRKSAPRIAYDDIQRRESFKEFKAVHEGSVTRKSNSNICQEPFLAHKARSGSLGRFPKRGKEPQSIQTVNIELPPHYGGDRAVQLIQNKIKPKRASRAPKADAPTELIPVKSSVKVGSRTNVSVHKQRKSVTIVDKLHTIEEFLSPEESLENCTKNTNDTHEFATLVPSQHSLKEIETQINLRTERICKTLPKYRPRTYKSPRKKFNKHTLLSALDKINKQIETMQEKYLKIPKSEYKSVNDSFTQSENVEVLYENDKYPEDAKPSAAVCSPNSLTDNILSDMKMQERIKEMREMFPEFPKIEDTLKEIENHLDNIVNFDSSKNIFQPNSFNQPSEYQYGQNQGDTWNGGALGGIRNSMEQTNSGLKSISTDELLRRHALRKQERQKSLRYQIDEVEEFCDRISEIANEDYDDRTEEELQYSRPSTGSSPTRPTHLTSRETNTGDDTNTYPDIQKTIKKSNYLSKEFNKIDERTSSSMVKVFSDSRRSLWKNNLTENKVDYSGVENVTRMLDSLKISLQNSIYEPVPQ